MLDGLDGFWRRLNRGEIRDGISLICERVATEADDETIDWRAE